MSGGKNLNHERREGHESLGQKRFSHKGSKAQRKYGITLPVVKGVSVPIRKCLDFGLKKNLNHEIRERHEGERRFHPLIKMMNTAMAYVGELPISVYQCASVV